MVIMSTCMSVGPYVCPSVCLYVCLLVCDTLLFTSQDNTALLKGNNIHLKTIQDTIYNYSLCRPMHSDRQMVVTCTTVM